MTQSVWCTVRVRVGWGEGSEETPVTATITKGWALGLRMTQGSGGIQSGGTGSLGDLVWKSGSGLGPQNRTADG